MSLTPEQIQEARKYAKRWWDETVYTGSYVDSFLDALEQAQQTQSNHDQVDELLRLGVEMRKENQRLQAEIDRLNENNWTDLLVGQVQQRDDENQRLQQENERYKQTFEIKLTPEMLGITPGYEVEEIVAYHRCANIMRRTQQLLLSYSRQASEVPK